MEVINMLRQVPDSHEFYALIWDNTVSPHKLVGYIIEIPNLFEHWAGQPITMGNTDSVILAKDYRGAAVFHAVYNHLAQEMHARGIIHREGTMIWSKNLPAMTSFSKIGFEYRRYAVMQKRW